MRDEDYNRFMRQESSSKHFAIIFLICILMCCLLVWSVANAQESMPYVDEKCAESFACQDRTYQLWYWGQVISTEDLTLEECQADLEDLQPQIEPFGGLECREAIVERQKS